MCSVFEWNDNPGQHWVNAGTQWVPKMIPYKNLLHSVRLVYHQLMTMESSLLQIIFRILMQIEASLESVAFRNAYKPHENVESNELVGIIQMKAFLWLFLQLYQCTKNAWKS